MAKAFGGGADFVMVGGQFAGHDQNPGECISKNGKQYKMFYGMSSDSAKEALWENEPLSVLGRTCVENPLSRIWLLQYKIFGRVAVLVRILMHS